MTKFFRYITFSTLVFTAVLLWGSRATHQLYLPEVWVVMLNIAWSIFIGSCYYKQVLKKVMITSELPQKVTYILTGMGILSSLLICGVTYAALCHFYLCDQHISQLKPWEKIVIGISGVITTLGLIIGGFQLYWENRRLSRS